MICDPSYVMGYVDAVEAEFETGTEPLTLIVENLDINADRASYDALVGKLMAGNPGYPAPTAYTGGDNTGEVCPVSCLDGRFQAFSWYDAFCASRGAAGCSIATSHTTADVVNFLDSDLSLRIFYKMVALPADALTAPTTKVSVRHRRCVRCLCAHDHT